MVMFVVTLLISSRLHVGTFAGVALNTVFFLYRRAYLRIIEVAQHKDGILRDRDRFDLPQLAPTSWPYAWIRL